MKRKPAHAVLLHADGDAWHLGSVGPAGLVMRVLGTDPESLADPRSPRVVLALSSEHWLCGTIATADLPRRGRREAMVYRFEEKLPVAAEDLAADFVESAGVALGVATGAAALRDLVASVAAKGVRVTEIVPLPLLALQGKPPATGVAFVVWQHDGEAEVIGLRDGVPRSWATLAADDGEVRLHLRLAGAGDLPPVVELRDASPALALELATDELDVRLATTDGLALCAVAGAAKVRAGERPTVDVSPAVASLLGTRSAGTALTAALLAACLFLAVCSASLLWSASRSEAAARDAEGSLTAAYTAAFPQERVPPTPNIRRRLEIEAKRLSGGDAATTTPTDAFDLAARTLADLPKDVRFRLFEFRVGPSEIYVDGQTRTHADADALAVSLRNLGGFDVGPPGTDQIDAQTVGFRIAATPTRLAETGGRP